MESVYHIVTIRVNETSWAHVWWLHSLYLGMGYDRQPSHGPLTGDLLRPTTHHRGHTDVVSHFPPCHLN
jgi:hypothetical protein